MGRQPVIIGVGEIGDPVGENLQDAKTIVDLMSAAADAAIMDTGAAAEALRAAIDTVAVVRTFPDSSPAHRHNFGDVANFPRAVARSLGCNPETAVYSVAGGQVPQQLVTEYSEKISRGEADLVLLVGGETIATAKAAMKAGAELDWSDDTSGQLEERGMGVSGLVDWQQMENQLTFAPTIYALFENARRAALGMTLEDYAVHMGELFARFSEVAANHPIALDTQSYSAKDVYTAGDANPYVAFPYTRNMVAKDGVNQSAAILLASTEMAEKLGLEESRFVYPVSGCDASERPLIERPALGSSIAMKHAYEALFRESGLKPADMDVFDLYSCFPIAVFSALDALEISADDPRPLTVTGGLPFFGGAGNNYSMHGIVNLTLALRKEGRAFGLIGANGGFLSKHSLGIYASAAPEAGWQSCDSKALQALIDRSCSEAVDPHPEGAATIESYSVAHKKGQPAQGFIVGRTTLGDRFIAHSEPGDDETLATLLREDPMGSRVYVTSKGPGTRFTFERQRTRDLVPPRPSSLEEDYRYCSVSRSDHILEVTINRPEARNSLSSSAHYELDGIFDLYESDSSLWVAIITGAGDEAFCAGNDLKATAAGEATWFPPSGFGGLTQREGRKKPVIAAVNGFAMGGGMEIALACDLVVAAESATFALPEVKVGLMAAAGGIQRLTRQATLKQAMEMLLLGTHISAARALELGLVNQVVERGQTLSAAREMARRLLEVSPTSVSCTLQRFNESERYADTVQAIQSPSESFIRLITSEDMQEGVKAFVQKRKPDWKGA